MQVKQHIFCNQFFFKKITLLESWVSNKAGLLLINLVWVIKPLILLKDKLHSLVWFWNRKASNFNQSSSSGWQEILQDSKESYFLIWIRSPLTPGGFWRLHALSLSFIGCCVIKYPTHVFKFDQAGLIRRTHLVSAFRGKVKSLSQ